MEEKFIGVIEDNEHEGETFGYYFPQNEDNIKALGELEHLLDAGLFTCYFIDWEPYTKEELRLISKGANNSYMDRVNFVTKKVDWESVFEQLENDEDPLYKGDCFR